MTLNEIRLELASPPYDFLTCNRNLGSNVCLLCLGGSYAYGLDRPTSDIDLRGVAVNSEKDILLWKDFKQFSDKDTDTVIYSFLRILELLSKSNPSIIEILGCKPEHYLYKNDIGDELLKNADMFLSKICMYSFGGAIKNRLDDLENISSNVCKDEKVLTSSSNKSIVKCMAHIVRLYYMCIDILSKKEVITYREDEHDLLMSILHGDFLDNNNNPSKDFYALVSELSVKMDEAMHSSTLQDKPDYGRIEEFKLKVLRDVVKGYSNGL